MSELHTKSTTIVKNMSSKTLASNKSVIGLQSISSRVGIRRKSYGFGKVPGIKPVVDVNSQIAIEFKRPHLVYLPTYRLEPTEPFHFETVSNLVKATIKENFANHKYNGQESPALALRLAGEVMRKVKRLNFDRYRIISVVTIGQKRAQSFNHAISFLWDHERDNYVEANAETSTAYIQIIVFGVYLD